MHNAQATNVRPMSDERFRDLLSRLMEGDQVAAGELAEEVFQDLRRVARLQLRRERPNHTVRPTALASEACMKLLASRHLPAESRGHFLALAARTMRRYLIEYARTRSAVSRGGGQNRVPFDETLSIKDRDLVELLELQQALERLEQADRRQAEIIEMHYFGGATVEDIAAHLSLSERQVKRDMAAAREFLRIQLSAAAPEEKP